MAVGAARRAVRITGSAYGVASAVTRPVQPQTMTVNASSPAASASPPRTPPRSPTTSTPPAMHASCPFAAADVATVHVRARTSHVDARGWESAPGSADDMVADATTLGPRAARPPRAPALLLGLGLGGFVDGIVLHQIVQD